MTGIGLYGGTFDPVHNGHVAVARAAINQFELARLYVAPAYQPPHRLETAASFADRLAMARLAFAGWPTVTVSDLESQRGGISYTVDSIEALQELSPHAELFLVVGADAAEEIETWREPERLAQVVRLLIAPRPDCTAHLLPHWRVDLIRMEPIAVSATGVREAVRAGRPIDHSVPNAVAEYIVQHGLYRSN